MSKTLMHAADDSSSTSGLQQEQQQQSYTNIGSAFTFAPSGGRGRRYPRSGYTSPGARSIASLGSVDRFGCFTAVRMTATAKLNRFFRRLVRFRQMDFEFALWQMIYLLAKPQKVYRNFMYRKKTKDQWARDDPAFLVLLAAALLISSVLFAWAIRLSFAGFVAFFLWVVFVDCILSGIIIATVLWFIVNRFLRRVDDQDVEWAFCFDVHLNAFFPMLILLHVLMPLTFSHMIGFDAFFPRLYGNTLWFIAVVYYIYITFLGYTALPILKNTHIFLYPVTFLFIFYVATVTAGWNISQTAMDLYHFRAENRQRRL